MLEIDGSYGEGGGQLVRTSVALAAVTNTPIRIRSIRAKRKPSGLAPQHLAAVRAAADLCRGHLEGAESRSQKLVFAPGRIQGGSYTFDIGTAGSITLLLQALLPMMVSARQQFSLRVIGGTDVRASPPFDYFSRVFMPLLSKLGVAATARLVRRGYYPRGGGIVEVVVEPSELQSLAVEEPGTLLEIAGNAHVANLPLSIAERMRASALASLTGRLTTRRCNVAAIQEESAVGPGGAVVLWARHEHCVVGAARVAERGVPAERLGSEASAELCADLTARTTLDIHAADQVLAYLALAIDAGPSHFTVREISSHAHTGMWLIEQMLPVRFSVERREGCWRVGVTHGSNS
ncbi:MAG TPA: RNA 3'-terminal phosphate cyclase [Steroidobacteraceae bacterium]